MTFVEAMKACITKNAKIRRAGYQPGEYLYVADIDSRGLQLYRHTPDAPLTLVAWVTRNRWEDDWSIVDWCTCCNKPKNPHICGC